MATQKSWRWVGSVAYATKKVAPKKVIHAKNPKLDMIYDHASLLISFFHETRFYPLAPEKVILGHLDGEGIMKRSHF